MKTLLYLIAGLVSLVPLQAQVGQGFSFEPRLSIPDGNATGIWDTRIIEMSYYPNHPIISVSLYLEITGEFFGDLFMDLRHSSGHSVLLNRPGRTLADPFGYDKINFKIRLADTGENDIHTYREHNPTPPTGDYALSGQPDARTADPSTVLDSSPRTAFLSSFNGLDPNGEWTLFMADLSNGGTNVLRRWDLYITVPEPRSVGLIAGMVLLLVGVLLSRQRHHS